MMGNAALEDTPPEDYVRSVVEQSGSSFFWAMRMLEPARRDANFAIYAFCRVVDDIADDEDIDAATRRALLGEWRTEIARLYANEPKHPITKALLPAVQAFGLKCDDFLAIIEGMEMDAEGPIVAPSMQALLYYCDRVASAVGRLCVKVYGEPAAEGEAVADHLGLALQLTNILRDVAEDAERGRLYLPQELLDKYGMETRDPMRVAQHPDLPKVSAELGARAEAEFKAAREALLKTSRRKMRPAIIMMEVYYRTLRRLRAHGWRMPENINGMARLSDKMAKLAIAIRHGVL